MTAITKCFFYYSYQKVYSGGVFLFVFVFCFPVLLILSAEGTNEKQLQSHQTNFRISGRQQTLSGAPRTARPGADGPLLPQAPDWGTPAMGAEGPKPALLQYRRTAALRSRLHAVLQPPPADRRPCRSGWGGAALAWPTRRGGLRHRPCPGASRPKNSGLASPRPPGPVQPRRCQPGGWVPHRRHRPPPSPPRRPHVPFLGRLWITFTAASNLVACTEPVSAMSPSRPLPSGRRAASGEAASAQPPSSRRLQPTARERSWERRAAGGHPPAAAGRGARPRPAPPLLRLRQD